MADREEQCILQFQAIDNQFQTHFKSLNQTNISKTTMNTNHAYHNIDYIQ